MTVYLKDSKKLENVVYIDFTNLSVYIMYKGGEVQIVPRELLDKIEGVII